MSSFHFVSPNPAQKEDHVVNVPAGIVTKAALLDFLHSAIPLPGYFGRNWDALEECLNDFEWMKHPRLILLHGDIPLKKASSDQRTYLQILDTAGRESERLYVAFPESDREEVKAIFPNEK